MRSVLQGSETPPYMNSTARDLLWKAREAYARLGLRNASVLEVGNGVLLLPWVGTKKLETLGLALAAKNFEPRVANHAIEVPHTNVVTTKRVLADLAQEGVPDGDALAAKVALPFKEKFGIR
jgi:ATP-dependent Lhr-like helicase